MGSLSEALLIAGGMGRAIDAAIVSTTIFLALAASGVWLISVAIRKRVFRGEWWTFALFWALVIGFTVFVWEGGRIADERRHQQLMEEWDRRGE
jgi:predicted membrane channel-forming protein YqfA (hemolysin III family)